MNITTVGIDLAKNVFSVHGVNAYGKAYANATSEIDTSRHVNIITL